MAVSTPGCDTGWTAPTFNLPATDGSIKSLADVAGPNGTLIMFICNHCPFVKGITDRLVTDMKSIREFGINPVAICSNDASSHPEDSFENMKIFAEQNGFTFPYLHDETQQVARAYGAVCTPDFFGFNANLELQYRGRLDSAGKNPAEPGTPRELVEAMKRVAATGKGPDQQFPLNGLLNQMEPRSH